MLIVLQFTIEKENPKRIFKSDRNFTKAVIKDALGPGLYTIKVPQAGAQFSFGSRFNSDIRSKEHLFPKKADGPGPGDY